jgi:hypothetical protein
VLNSLNPESFRERSVKKLTTVVRPNFPTNAVDALFNFFNCADDGVELGPVAGIEFGMKELSIGTNLKCAATRGDERERLDPFAEFENLGRQTDGLRRVVSNYAVFDRHLSLHLELLSEEKLSARGKPVKRGSGVVLLQSVGPRTDELATRKIRVSAKLMKSGALIKACCHSDRSGESDVRGHRRRDCGSGSRLKRECLKRRAPRESASQISYCLFPDPRFAREQQEMSRLSST